MRSAIVLVLLVLLLTVSAAVQADVEPLEPETISVESLGAHTPHWMVLNDSNFLGYMDSKAYLVDVDSGRTLGMLSTGGYRGAMEIAPDFSLLYSLETYYPRVTRGDRTDVITVYDTKNLAAVDEIIIPPKRATGAMMRGYSGMSDDGRFMFVANMTPAMSVTVVDLVNRSVIAETPTSGCMIVLPTGPRSFAMLCGDGTLMHLKLDDQGQIVSKEKTPPFFSAADDPVTERAARAGNTWYLISFYGQIHPVNFASGDLVVAESFSALSESELAADWRTGGAHYVAAHAGLNRYFVVVNQDGEDSHKNPGDRIYAYDLNSQERVLEIVLPGKVTQLGISNDAKPVLVAGGEDPPIYVIDPTTGELIKTLEGPILGAGMMQFPSQ
ncbi:MAG: amine dehydrogenase large subunit [Proteobacteria bacterium]|nr:amine dehydrogenase large subunit [Pseudomonadota bacterium]